MEMENKELETQDWNDNRDNKRQILAVYISYSLSFISTELTDWVCGFTQKPQIVAHN